MTTSGLQPPRRATYLGWHSRAASRTCAVLSAGCLVLGLAGCGNWISVTDAGQVGLTVDTAGKPVLAVMTCATARPVIELHEGRKKSDPDSLPNVQRGSWEARRGFSDVEMLAVTAPGENWKTTRGPGPLEPDRLFVVNGGTLEDEDASLGTFSFRTRDLARLSPDQVLVAGKVESLRTFGDYKCR